ncbi:hypothetical protein E1H99_03120 [Enterococcus hirae]|nr:hypothetical protein E1H99_03120 [Enterococcus hirae]
MLNRKLSKLFITLMFTIISSQIVFTPISIVYAQPIKDQEDLSPIELPTMKNYLAMGKSDPQFFFTKSRMQGTIEKLIEVTFFSDQEVSSVRVGFPEEAEIVKVKLPSGFSIEQVEQSHEWIIQTESIQHTFVLPIIFDSAGSYEVTKKQQ